MMRECSLQRAVVRVRVRSEVFEIRRSNALERCAGADVVARRIDNLARATNGVRCGTAITRDGTTGCDWNDDRVLWRREPCLIWVVGRAQARALRSDITQLRKPLVSECSLNGEVPLLRRAGNPVQRHRQLNEAVDRSGIGRAALRAISCNNSVRKLAAAIGETGKLRSLGHVRLGRLGSECWNTRQWEDGVAVVSRK